MKIKEIACFEPLILQQCFQKLSALDISECVCKWEKVNIFPDIIVLVSFAFQMSGKLEEHT